MLYYLFESLARDFTFFNVFRYITLRGILGVLTALLISFWIGPTMIRLLGVRQLGQTVRKDGPQSHLSKAGTPTMGGALILIAIAISTLLWADLSNRFVLAVLFATASFGAIGWVDDYKKIINKDPRGVGAGPSFSGRRFPVWRSRCSSTTAPKAPPTPHSSCRCSRTSSSTWARFTSCWPTW